MKRPTLLLAVIACLLSGCESLSSFFSGDHDTQVAPLKIQKGDPGSNEFTEIPAEEVQEDSLPEIAAPNPQTIAPVGFGESPVGLGKRSRPDGHYLPLVLFPFDSWELTPEAEKTLQDASDWLRGYLHGGLTIEGHTDAQGTEAYNQALGYRRAQAVMKYLEDLGIKQGTMELISYGELDPICDGDDEFCYDMNRRAFMFVANRKISSLLKSLETPLQHERTRQRQENEND